MVVMGISPSIFPLFFHTMPGGLEVLAISPAIVFFGLLRFWMAIYRHSGCLSDIVSLRRDPSADGEADLTIGCYWFCSDRCSDLITRILSLEKVITDVEERNGEVGGKFRASLISHRALTGEMPDAGPIRVSLSVPYLIR